MNKLSKTTSKHTPFSIIQTSSLFHLQLLDNLFLLNHCNNICNNLFCLLFYNFKSCQIIWGVHGCTACSKEIIWCCSSKCVQDKNLAKYFIFYFSSFILVTTCTIFTLLIQDFYSNYTHIQGGATENSYEIVRPTFLVLLRIKIMCLHVLLS